MKILFLGGDKRQIEIIKGLKDKNRQVDIVGFKNAELDDNYNKVNLNDIDIKDYDVIILPVDGLKNDFSITTAFDDEKIVLSKDIFRDCKKNIQIFTGVRTNSLNELINPYNLNLTPLMEDKEIKEKNSIPTVEGIIGDLVFNTDRTIHSTNILVLGYGNVGKRLTSILYDMGSNVSVGIIEKDDFDVLTKKGISCVYTNNREMMKQIMGTYDVVINTVPSLILDKDYLNLLNKDVYILDISSYPHGVDFESAKALNLHNKLFLGIPSIVAPKTAGQILSKKINLLIGGEGNE